MSGSWLSKFDIKEKKYILVGVAAAGYFQGTYWLWFWAVLQCDDETKESFWLVSRKLETAALELLASHG